ncbi:LysR family transcriptional regulator [Fodinicurvata halophila]|uniref:LysR family transcriptional regulator n=1 Tax=Fodinicurvata halophila TaxID=1419723 RepID=UPI0036420787
MSRRVYDLPPLTALAAFETAARHLSFKNAAVELNVTPGAVSHQIRALEEELGASLFVRRHRGVDLTEEGDRLFSTLAESFVRISQRLREIGSAMRRHG